MYGTVETSGLMDVGISDVRGDSTGFEKQKSCCRLPQPPTLLANPSHFSYWFKGISLP